MQAPEDVAIGLKGIKDTFRLVLNQRGRAVAQSSFDVNGRPRDVEYEPRWELWDIDAFGASYRVAILEKHPRRGGFLPPSMKFVEHMNLINPSRYDGDMSKMVEAMVDKPNEYAEELAEDQFRALVNAMADEYYGSGSPRVSVSASIS
jgi:hypothetical protein